MQISLFLSWINSILHTELSSFDLFPFAVSSWFLVQLCLDGHLPCYKKIHLLSAIEEITYPVHFTSRLLHFSQQYKITCSHLFYVVCFIISSSFYLFLFFKFRYLSYSLDSFLTYELFAALESLHAPMLKLQLHRSIYNYLVTSCLRPSGGIEHF